MPDNEVIAYAYSIRATVTYELALNTVGEYPIGEGKKPYKKALQDINKAIALDPAIAEDEEMRELRNSKDICEVSINFKKSRQRIQKKTQELFR